MKSPAELRDCRAFRFERRSVPRHKDNVTIVTSAVCATSLRDGCPYVKKCGMKRSVEEIVPELATLLEEQRKLLILHTTVFSDAEAAAYENRQDRIEVLRLELELVRNAS